MDIGERFPHIQALAQGTISGRFSEWPKLQPEARAILAVLAEAEAGLERAYQAGVHDGERTQREFPRCEGS